MKNDNANGYTLFLVNTDGITFNTKSLEFGTTHEPIARQLYFRKYKVEHKNAHLSTCGLFLSKKTPYIMFYTLKSFICEHVYFDKEFFDEMW